jgi:hydrophobe/amphiphile efflux-3 (HAE3) family protein
LFAEKIIRYRWFIIVLFLIVTGIFASQIPTVEIDTDLKSQLPEDMPSRLSTDRIDSLFGGTEMIMVIVQTEDILNSETLKRIRRLSKKIKRVKGVEKVHSLFDLKSIRGEDGALIIEPAVYKIPKDDLSREKLRKNIIENDIVYGSVVAKDFSLAAVIALLTPDARDEKILGSLRQIIDEIPGDEKTWIGGLPVTRVEMGEYIRHDMRLLLPIGISVMLIFLFACFRQIRGVVLPFLVVLVSIIVSIGFISMIGWKIHMVTVILPILLIAVANDYGIHMIARYQEDNIPSNNFDANQLAQRIFQSLNRPVLITGLTTMAGMLCLLGHILIPAKELGVLAAFGILFALAASLFLLPAVISLLPRSKPILGLPQDGQHRAPFFERLLNFFSDLVSDHPKQVLIYSTLLALISLIGIFFVVVDTNPNGYYKPDNPTVLVSQLIDQNLGGSQTVSVVYQGDIKSPELVRKIDHMENQILNMDEIGTTVSIARVFKQMSKALDDQQISDQSGIPETKEGIAQYLELYSISGDPDDLTKMVDFSYEHAIVSARVNKTSTAVIRRVVDRIKGLVEDDKDVILVGGFGVVLADLAEAVVNGQIFSLILATIVVGFLVSFLFRSVTAGFIATIPLTLSIIITFGLMGVFAIELNIATAMLSSIMIGVGVDYTIHFLWRYRVERNSGYDFSEAVKITLSTTGRGIVFNALSVIVGFSALFFSSFLPVQFFGFLVVISIFACLIGALVVVPAICLVFKPEFLNPKVSA